MTRTMGVGLVSATLTELYRNEYDRMVRVAWLLVGSRQTAEDLVQDSFVRVGQRFDDLRDPSAYLRVAVVNACRNDKRRRRFRSSQAVPDQFSTEQFADDGDPTLYAALGALSVRQRMVLVLRFVDDCPDGQIAELLGVRPATVRSLAFRGLARLRELIEP